VADAESTSVLEALRSINRAWLGRCAEEMAPRIHPDIVMVFPSFSGSVRGRDAFLAGFAEFCAHAEVLSFREWDHQADANGDTAVASFAWEMVYRREGRAWKATGRDLWVFARRGEEWLAVWRTMANMTEEAAKESDLAGIPA
jgi:hypothetical protein